MKTQNMLEDNEPHPCTFLSKIEDGIFEDLGNASNFPVQVKPLEHSSPFKDEDVSHNDPFLMEHIKGLSTIMGREWLAKTELSTEVA
jgi:hypothetical protein